MSLLPSLSTAIADLIEWLLCVIARRTVAFCRAYQAWRLCYQTELRETSLRPRDYEVFHNYGQ